MDKLNKINNYFKEQNNAIVAFSGGVDSSLLLFLVMQSMKKYLAITFNSYLYSKNETELINKFVKEFNVNHRYIDIDPLSEIQAIRCNPEDRCYHCKYELYSKLTEIKFDEGFEIIFDGANADDRKNIHRQGARATAELSIVSPLADFGFSKDDIRKLAEFYKLPMFNKPSLSCYLTRFEYGVAVDRTMIDTVTQLEEYLHSLSLLSARCRVHNRIVRIQFDENDMLIAIKLYREDIVKKAMNLGYKYATIDLAGNYSGSMDI